MLPSEYTSQNSSFDDAAACANAHVRLLKSRYRSRSAEGREAITNTLAPMFAGARATDTTEENIQSRLRGLLLMAMSNKFGEMLLTTGNKSEVARSATPQSTATWAGGYNPIKDLYKIRVFETCRWRNQNHRDWMMGTRWRGDPHHTIIDKPPTAELRDDQKDSDSLARLRNPRRHPGNADGPRRLRRPIAYAAGYDRDAVKRVEHLLYISEYKRFPIRPRRPAYHFRAFWLDRRYPIANRWRDNG